MSFLDRLASLRPTRRGFVAGVAAGVAAGGVLAYQAPVRAEGRDQIPMEELMAKGELDELSIGSPDAKVVIVEYASMTCGHCAAFHNEVFPKLKEKYIDTGKVRLVLREFPLDNLAAAASMLARCSGPADKAFALTSVLFHKQRDWAVPGNAVPKLFEIAKQAGFTEENFNKCLTDQPLLDKIAAVRAKASDTFGVNSTPTFFINGTRLKGRSDQIETFDKALEPLLKSS